MARRRRLPRRGDRRLSGAVGRRTGRHVSEAIVVGSGPNGLTCAAVLARAGMKVTVLEGADTIGGGTRTSELTLPGVLHDHCSAVHPMSVASPVFNSLGL